MGKSWLSYGSVGHDDLGEKKKWLEGDHSPRKEERREAHREQKVRWYREQKDLPCKPDLCLIPEPTLKSWMCPRDGSKH